MAVPSHRQTFTCKFSQCLPFYWYVSADWQLYMVFSVVTLILLRYRIFVKTLFCSLTSTKFRERQSTLACMRRECESFKNNHFGATMFQERKDGILPDGCCHGSGHSVRDIRHLREWLPASASADGQGSGVSTISSLLTEKEGSLSNLFCFPWVVFSPSFPPTASSIMFCLFHYSITVSLSLVSFSLFHFFFFFGN